jgi:drug/metabolite transporter (DMT)-like permease
MPLPSLRSHFLPGKDIYATLAHIPECCAALLFFQRTDTSLDTISSPTPARSGRALSWFLLILANLLWAGSYVAAKLALVDFSVNMMNALRMMIAALVLLPLLIARRKSLRLTRRDLFQLALLALIGFVINKILEYGGLALTTASDVALLIAGESIFTAILSWFVLRERFRLATGLALLLGLLGVYLIIERSLVPTIPAGGGAWRMLGDLLVVLALTFEAFFTVRGKSLLVKHSPLLVTAAAIVGSNVFWLPMAGYELLAHGWHPVSWQSWLGLLWLALMSTAVAYLSWFKGLERVEGSRAATTLFIQPLLGATLAIILLGDQLVPTTIVGGALILVSVYILSRQEKIET